MLRSAAGLLSRAAGLASPSIASTSYAVVPVLRWVLHQPAATISTSSALADSSPDKASKPTITVTFVMDKDGTEQSVKAPVGESLLEVAHDHDIELEGACEGSLACSTCHVIVEDEGMFEKLPEPCEDELDMLDLAFGLTETSRLGCQVIASPELDGLRVRIPAATRNMYVDGHVPKPH